MVVRLLKGVFNLRPPAPRYRNTWDVKPVLEKLRTMTPLNELSLKDITLKLVMLMALTQAARVQTLHLLVLKNITIEEHSISVWLGGNIKQCRPQFNVQFLQFFEYTKDPNLCVCRTLKEYINRTAPLRDVGGEVDNLLVSFIKPHRAVSRDTVARWVKIMLNWSGVNTGKYTAGSVRAAAASRAKAKSVPLCYILAKAGWSRESTFAKYYDLKIVHDTDPFQQAVLEG